MSISFFSKLLIGTLGTSAVAVPSIGWSNSNSNLFNERQKLMEEIEKDESFKNSLNTSTVKERLKKDKSFLKEMKKVGLKKIYDTEAANHNHKDENGFCHIFIKKEQFNKVKNDAHTSTEKIKDLVEDKQEHYYCLSYQEIKEMAK